MIDIYDEVGYIKNVLEHGFGPKWRRDAELLARFYASEGMKKSDAKAIIKEKCKKYVPGYNEYILFSQVNKTVDNAYKMHKQGKKLREIREIVISKEAVDWFLNLENSFEITQDVIDEEYKGRKVKLKKNPINFNRTKMLFTLYIWTKVQEHYIKVPNVHYLKKYTNRFKKDSGVSSGFSINKEANILYDLGFIYINLNRGIDAKFIKDNPEVFDIPITEENKIVLTGYDMYKCGDWLAKQKFGSFVCANCGKEVPYKGTGRGQKNQKYCDDCHKLLFGKKEKHEEGKDKERKVKHCIDCGKEFKTSIHDYTSTRCYNCLMKLKEKRKAEQRLKQKLESIPKPTENNE